MANALRKNVCTKLLPLKKMPARGPMIRVNELDLSFLNLIHFRSGKRDMPAVQHEEVNLPPLL